MLVTVAIPVRNGGPRLAEVLASVRAQRLTAGVELELLVCDSASTDGSAQRCADAGARVLSIDPRDFSHGGTRNLLMAQARGELVAFLTQDAVPATPDWLSHLIGGFGLADQVGLVFGPYLPRAEASAMVARELRDWFGGLAVDGGPRVDRLSDAERGIGPGARALTARELYGPRPFFTDANGCVSRAAWERVPFREVPYAEDHVLALDMLAAGYAKVFVPAAGVVHSHDYSPIGWLRRSFDEARAVRSVYAVEDLGSIRRLGRDVRGGVGADLRAGGGLLSSVLHRGLSALGTALGARSEHLPPGLRRRFSLERRG